MIVDRCNILLCNGAHALWVHAQFPPSLALLLPECGKGGGLFFKEINMLIENTVKCAKCNEPNCHPTSVKVSKGDHTIEVDSKGIGIKTHPISGRGVTVAIEFWCENGGHQFSLNFSFHKGSTYKDTIIGSDDPAPRGSTTTIWRD